VVLELLDLRLGAPPRVGNVPHGLMAKEPPADKRLLRAGELPKRTQEHNLMA
jgi:hypothetical protein